MANYWISVRAVSGEAFTDAIDTGTTRYLKVPDGETPLPSHRIALSQWINEIIASFPTENSSGGPQIPAGDIVFFVHGYNNTAANVDAARQNLKTGLEGAGFACKVICFDWPSGDVAVAYLRDLDHAKATAVRLVNAGVKPFLTALRKDCDIRLHAVGHSMGCFVLREAFDHADDGSSTSGGWTVNQLVMFSGDVDAPSFSDGDADTESMYKHCYRLTNYFNGFDEILQISNVKRFGVEPRVGRVGLPMDAPSKAVNVDCSAYFRKSYPQTIGFTGNPAFTHSWWFGDPTFMADLAIVLDGAIDRDKIPTRLAGAGGRQILV